MSVHLFMVYLMNLYVYLNLTIALVVVLCCCRVLNASK